MICIQTLTNPSQTSTQSGFKLFMQDRVVQTSPMQRNIGDIFSLNTTLYIRLFFILSGEACHMIYRVP